jgi:murein DD-endopeptidase MepM/ murein hydrolase activator NlpD
MPSPIINGKITTPYKKTGKMWSKGYHTGVDYAQPVGTPVHAVADGTVANANWGKSYGIQIVQNLGDGTFCIYAHLSKSNKKAGESIKKGELIGYVGNTGNSTGAHLHFERRNNIRWSTGQDLDPMELING